MQHVQINAGPLAAGPPMAHVFRGIKGKGRSKHGTTACGELFDLDDATILAPMVRSTWGLCADCHREDHDDTDTVTEPATSAAAAPEQCDSLPPMNHLSNYACTLPNRHTQAHQNERISWSGMPNEYSVLAPIDRQRAQDRALGEAIAATYRIQTPTCDSRSLRGGVDCELPTGHDGAHKCGIDTWFDPKPKKEKKSKGSPTANHPPVAARSPAPVAPLRLEQLDVATIERSPLNHRTRFEGIEELGADIKANGLRVPIKVRPNPDYGLKPKAKRWQLVYGERRWRAAKSAGVKTLPALIAELDDLAVIKEQLVENISRSDVHPLEEADGYQALMETHGYSAERIAKETGKSRTAIYNRLKLRDLPEAAREACFAGKLSVSIADMIARIPVAKLREEATRDIIRGREQDRWELDQTLDEITQQVAEDLVDEDADDYIERNQPREGLPIEPAVVPLSTREASVLIKRRYMLRLEMAPFDPKDASLPGGACTSCVHRTGNQPDLFGDVASADVCTNPPCFETKRSESMQKKIQATKAAGLEVLPEKKAEHLFASDGSQTYSSPYFDLDEEAAWQYQEAEKGGNGERTAKTWRQILGGDAPAPTVALDHRGKAHELVDKKAALAALKEADRLPEGAKRIEKSKNSGAASEKKEREKHEIKTATALRAITAIVEDGTIGSVEIARWLAECVIRQASMEAHALVVKRRELAVSDKGSAYGRARNEDALLKLAKNLKTHALLEGLVIELLASENAATRYHTGYGTNLEAAAKPFGIDLAKIRKTVEAERKAPKKPPTTIAKGDDQCPFTHKDGKCSGCIYKADHAGPHGNGYRTWTNKDAKKKPAAKKSPAKKKGRKS
jgi:ParB/RepB/Spo0J family partition protein